MLPLLLSVGFLAGPRPTVVYVDEMYSPRTVNTFHIGGKSLALDTLQKELAERMAEIEAIVDDVIKSQEQLIQEIKAQNDPRWADVIRDMEKSLDGLKAARRSKK